MKQQGTKERARWFSGMLSACRSGGQEFESPLWISNKITLNNSKLFVTLFRYSKFYPYLLKKIYTFIHSFIHSVDS